MVVVGGDAEHAIKQVLAALQAVKGHSVLVRDARSYINDDDVVRPAAGAVWGLCRAARAEGVDVRVVDVDDEDSIPKELSYHTPEAAWRGRRFVPGLQKVEVEAGDDVGGGVHVVVGGAGGLGAAWAARLTGTVLVAGRREAKPATLTCDSLRSMRHHGRTRRLSSLKTGQGLPETCECLAPRRRARLCTHRSMRLMKHI